MAYGTIVPEEGGSSPRPMVQVRSDSSMSEGKDQVCPHFQEKMPRMGIADPESSSFDSRAHDGL